MCVYCITLVTFVLVQIFQNLKKMGITSMVSDVLSPFSLRSVKDLCIGGGVSRVLLWINLMVVLIYLWSVGMALLFQFSCLANPRTSGACRLQVHGVAGSLNEYSTLSLFLLSMH